MWNQELQIFDRELRDIKVPLDLRMEIGSFLSFVDSFFNGLVVDYMVQSKIADAREQAETAIRYIEPIVNQLRQQMQERKGDIYGMPWEYVMVYFWRGNQWA